MNQNEALFILETAPRLLTLLDRRTFSATYGCFDKSFWQYRMVTDFPSAVYQQGALALALLAENKFEGNIYYGQEAIRRYAVAAMAYWCRCQHADGSFDEWFPSERSFVATAFTAYAVSEAYLLLGPYWATCPEERDLVRRSLRRAGEWLSRQREVFVANHAAGAVAALYNIFLITGRPEDRAASDRALVRVLAMQDEEGWFREYGGPDIGYLSVSIDYLAKYYQKSRDKKAQEGLKKAVDFFVSFIHPDGSCGGEYGTRQTRYAMTHGLRILASENALAAAALEKLREGRRRRATPSAAGMDDRYFIFFMLPNAWQEIFEEGPTVPPAALPARYERFYERSGFVSVHRESFYLACNMKKNGVMSLYAARGPGRFLYADSGYVIAMGDGRHATSQGELDVAVRFDTASVPEALCESAGHFMFLKPPPHIGQCLLFFRLFNIVAGALPFVTATVTRWIKQLFIVKKPRAPWFMRRRIRIQEARIVIEDILEKRGRAHCVKIWQEPFGSLTFSPTSLTFVPAVLEAPRELAKAADTLEKNGRLTITTFLEMEADNVVIRREIR